MISKQCNSAWQTRWDRSSVARTTYDLAPTVGRRLLFPDDRCCAVSYARLLLNDSMPKLINIDMESTRHESASVGMVLMMHNTSFLSVNVIVIYEKR